MFPPPGSDPEEEEEEEDNAGRNVEDDAQAQLHSAEARQLLAVVVGGQPSEGNDVRPRRQVVIGVMALQEARHLLAHPNAGTRLLLVARRAHRRVGPQALGEARVVAQRASRPRKGRRGREDVDRKKANVKIRQRRARTGVGACARYLPA